MKGGERMNDLRVNYSETISVGNNVTTKGGEFAELLNKIKATNSELQTYWEGSDASKYSGAVAEQAQYMQQLSETINEIGDFLVKTGNAYREAMESNSAAIK